MQRARASAAGPALIGLTSVAALAGIVRATTPLLSGPDAYWHWDVGRRIVSGGLPRTDPYSFLTDGVEWILNQWGTDLVIGLTLQLGGLPLLALLWAVLTAATFAVVGWTAWRRAPRLSTVAIVGLAYVASMRALTLRGVLFTLLLLPLLYAEVERDEGPRWWVIGGIVILWTNLHAAVLLGIGVVTLHAVGTRLAGETRHLAFTRLPLKLLAVILIAASITPYGPRLLSQAVALGFRASSSAITEWGPPSLLSLAVLPFTMLMAIVLTAVAITASRRDLSDILLVVAFAILGSSAGRHIAPAAVILGVVGAPYVAQALDQVRGRLEVPVLPERIGRLDQIVVTVVLAVAVVAVALLVPYDRRPSAHIADVPAGFFSNDIKATRAFVPSPWAPALGTLPETRVTTAVDGRLELFTEAQITAYQNVMSADPGWEEQLNAWCVDLVVVGEDAVLDLVLRDHVGWELDRESAILRRPDVISRWYRRSHSTTPSCDSGD